MLGTLTDKGLLRRIQPAGSPARYEDRVGDNHHHLICRTCGQHGRRRLRRRRHPLPDRGRRLGLRDRRGRGHLLGPLSRLRRRATVRTLTTIDTQPTNREQGGPDVSEPRSESENPVIPAPTPKPSRPHIEPGLVAEPARPVGAPPARGRGRPDGRRLRLRGGVRDPRRRRAEAGRRRGDDDVAGLVAGRLRPLRAAVHPHGVARRRHLPHRRRPGRRRQRRAALRPAQQLARQRQPRQGAPAALAGQAEVRPEDLVGRPARLRRQLRAGVDGVQDVRLRLRAPGHLGARRGLLGPGGHVARRRALQRRPRARQPARRGADGPDLREPGGAERQPRSARRGARTSARRSPAWR